MKVYRKKTGSFQFLLNHFPVTGIIGPRQVGKTTLAKELIKDIQDAVYLDLELDSDLNKLSEPQLFLERNADKIIVLDEIQRMPSLFPLLRALIDQNRKPGKFLILGSASPNLIQYSSESLAGRVAYEELTPFNLMEIPDTYDIDTHWFWGGFPDPFLEKNDSVARVWMRNFIQTYLERDLRQLGLDVDPVLMRRFWSMLAHYHGNIWNASTFAKSLGITVPTVNRYLQFLEGAFIVRQLRPYHINIGKRLLKAPKVYLRDSGMLHYLANIENFDMLQGHVLVGHSWEGYVIEQIIQSLPDDVQAYYYRTHHGAEVDCVLVKGNQPVMSVEIKYSKTPKIEKGNRIAIDDLKTEKNIVIIPGEAEYPIQEDILVCGLRAFLEKLNGRFGS